MNLPHRRFIFSLLLLAASLISAPVVSTAQLVPPGDFQGKSHDEWGFDWSQWGIKTGLGGQSLPDTVDGVRYLPPNFGNNVVADLTIQQGTPLVFSPFYVFGEKYDNGTDDDPVLSEPVIDQIFQTTTFQTKFDGSVVLEGFASDFPVRTYDITLFPAPITYTTPRPVGGGVNAIAAFWSTGLTEIFDNLPLGQHTIVNVFTSPFFSPDPVSSTYNITVVPEPSTLMLLGSALLASIVCIRRR
jgi:hypothetical protein